MHNAINQAGVKKLSVKGLRYLVDIFEHSETSACARTCIHARGELCLSH